MTTEQLARIAQESEERNPLPKGWVLVRLGDVCILQRGHDLPSQTWIKGKYPIVGSNGIIGFHHEFMAKAPGVVTGRSGTIGKVHYIENDYFPHNTCLYVKDFKGNDPKFVKYLLESIDLKSLGAKTTAVPSLDRKNAHQVEVSVPSSVKEQKRIATILDEQLKAVEQAGRSVKEQLEAVKLLPGAFLRCIFESEEAQNWPKSKLGVVTSRIGSGTTPLGGQSSYEKTGIALIRSQNIHYNRFSYDGLAFISKAQDSEMEVSRVFENDVLLNITGASIGRVCVVPPDICPANVNQHVSVIRLKENLDPHFLSFYLSTPKFQDFIFENQVGATRQALTKAMIEEFLIPMPTIEDQRKIAEILNEQMQEVESVKNSLNEQFKVIKKLPSALVRRAFAGEL